MNGSGSALIGADTSTQYRNRWSEIQARFVDSPRDSVQDADALVAEVMDSLSGGFDRTRADLERHAAEMDTHESFNYALFDRDETELLGCVYIDPPEKPGADGEISWWVVDAHVGGPLERALDETVPRWIAEVWPLTAPRYVGRDLSWDDWLALPER